MKWEWISTILCYNESVLLPFKVTILSVLTINVIHIKSIFHHQISFIQKQSVNFTHFTSQCSQDSWQLTFHKSWTFEIPISISSHKFHWIQSNKALILSHLKLQIRKILVFNLISRINSDMVSHIQSKSLPCPISVVSSDSLRISLWSNKYSINFSKKPAISYCNSW